MSKHYIIPIFVPHFGCPHDCVFCNQKKITGLSTNVTREYVFETIEAHLKTFKEPNIIEVAFYGGSFTAIDLPTQELLLSVAFDYKKRGMINKIRLSTRPDAISEEILSLLKKYQIDIIELGVQSLDDKVLLLSERGHSIEDVYYASKLIRDWGFSLGLQMMLGLPGDDETKSLETARKIISIKPDLMRIYPTLVIKNTPLERMYQNGEYTPISIEDSVRISGKILMKCTLEGINVIRIGLQPTENIQMGKDVVAGPFHPSFRQLVETWIIDEILKEFFISKRDRLTNSSLIIQTSNRLLSAIVGQRGSNKDKIIKDYKLRSFKIYGNNYMKDIIIVSINGEEVEIELVKSIKNYLLNNPL